MFLNTCFSIHVAKQVIDTFISNGIEAHRIPVVIGWVGTVKDSASVEFARRFYANLKDRRNPSARLNYIGAYTTACHVIDGQADWDIDPASSECTGVPCLLHCDSTKGVVSYCGGNKVDHIEENQVNSDSKEAACGESDHEADEHSSDGEGGQNNDSTEDLERSMNNFKGRKEVEGLEHLGFVFVYRGKPIRMDAAGNGSKSGNHPKTVYMTDNAVREVFGLSSACGYPSKCIWNPTSGAVVSKTKARLASGHCTVDQLNKGIRALQESSNKREREAGDAGHDHMMKRLSGCVNALKALAAAPPDVVAAPAEEQAATRVTSTPSVNAVPFVLSFSATAFVPAATHQTLSRANSESLC